MTGDDAARVIGIELAELRAFAAEEQAERATAARSLDVTLARCVDLVDALPTQAKRAAVAALIEAQFAQRRPS